MQTIPINQYEQELENKQIENAEKAGVVNTQTTAPSEKFIFPTADGTTTIDVDLSKLSQTIMLAEITSTLNPDDYLGKTIRFPGEHTAYKVDETGERWMLSCIIRVYIKNEWCFSSGRRFS